MTAITAPQYRLEGLFGSKNDPAERQDCAVVVHNCHYQPAPRPLHTALSVGEEQKNVERPGEEEEAESAE